MGCRPCRKAYWSNFGAAHSPAPAGGLFEKVFKNSSPMFFFSPFTLRNTYWSNSCCWRAADWFFRACFRDEICCVVFSISFTNVSDLFFQNMRWVFIKICSVILSFLSVSKVCSIPVDEVLCKSCRMCFLFDLAPFIFSLRAFRELVDSIESCYFSFRRFK